jgi:dTDP-4-amino-4,6-dideoxygalactose transaminase
VSTVNAFVLRGARPVFADIRSDTLNLDEAKLDQLITPKTKIVVVVHYGGIAAEMDRIVELCGQRGVAVVEDNAHGLFARYRGKTLGTLGVLGTQSFHHTKNFSSGEGGALLVNRPDLVERAEILREKGTNRARFFRGQVDKYSWVDIGSSYLPSELNAAYLLAQLEVRDDIQNKRRLVWERYHRELGVLERHGVSRPFVPEYCEQAYHVYYLLLPTLELRERFIGHMKDRDVVTPFHYVPLHLSDMGARFGGHRGQCPVTESVSDRLVRLPLFYNLSEAEQARVIESTLEFFG